MELGKALNMPGSTRTYMPSTRLPLPKCNVGVEVETEGVKGRLPPDMAEFWDQKQDESLRGNAAEYVLREPLFGEDLITALKRICSFGLNNKLQCNYRTSLHVHLDARDLTFDAFQALCCLYACVEEALFAWVGDKREESIFCLPWYSAEGDIESIRSLFIESTNLKNQAGRLGRYSGLNLNSLSKFGSIEFRHLRTTYDFQRIFDWVCICQHLKRYAVQLASSDGVDYSLLEMYSTKGIRLFLNEIFGEELSAKLRNSFSGDLYNGISLAQDLMRNDIQRQLGVIFSPPNSFLTQGANPYFKIWAAKLKKSKEKPREEESERPPPLRAPPPMPLRAQVFAVDNEPQIEGVQRFARAQDARLEQFNRIYNERIDMRPEDGIYHILARPEPRRPGDNDPDDLEPGWVCHGYVQSSMNASQFFVPSILLNTVNLALSEHITQGGVNELLAVLWEEGITRGTIPADTPVGWYNTANQNPYWH